MGLKPGAGSSENAARGMDKKMDEVETNEDRDEKAGECNEVEQVVDFVSEKVKEVCDLGERLPIEKLSDWEARRYGSIAARLLHDIKIT